MCEPYIRINLYCTRIILRSPSSTIRPCSFVYQPLRIHTCTMRTIGPNLLICRLLVRKRILRLNRLTILDTMFHLSRPFHVVQTLLPFYIYPSQFRRSRNPICLPIPSVKRVIPMLRQRNRCMTRLRSLSHLRLRLVPSLLMGRDIVMFFNVRFHRIGSLFQILSVPS